MRTPPDDGAGQRDSRRRDRGSADARSAETVGRGDSEQVTGRAGRRDGSGRHSLAGSAVFAPDYDGARPAAGPEPAPASDGNARGWYGSTAGGSAGKGPVRGYPPVPGQPPPMYPPGQFAAWNRGGDRTTRPAGQQPGPADPGRTGGQPALREPGTGGPAGRLAASTVEAGPTRSRHGRDGSGPAAPAAGRAGERPGPLAGQNQAQPEERGRPQGGWQAPGPGGSSSRYYEQDFSSEAEPSYSMLAVSDPAADVTSTQTWQAVGDGRATGIWTAPRRPDGNSPASGSAAAPGGTTAARPGTVVPEPRVAADRGPTGSARTGSGGTDTAATAITSGGAAAAGRTTGGTAPTGTDGAGSRAARGRSGAHTGPHSVSKLGRSARRKRPASVKLALAAALLLVLAAAGTLAYSALGKPASPHATSGPSPSAPAASTSPSPSLGPYGHIGSRKADSEPLTVGQLYPTTFTSAGGSVVRTAASRSPHCSSHVVGSKIQSAIGSAGCDQIVRATYLASGQKLMGTIGVLNLSTAARAKTAARSANASNFVAELTAKHGPTHKIGRGTGIEEAAAKGHYLILIWAEFTDLRKPKTASQRTQVEQFLTELLQNTANVSLTTRMVSGTP